MTTGCTGGINSGPIVVNSGGINIVSNVPGDTTMKLYNNAGTLTWNGAALAVGSSVSGTTGTISVFTAPNALGDSIITQTGGNTITVTGTFNATAAIQLNGTSINTAGTLTNVAYENQANVFVPSQSFSAGIGISGGSPSTHGIMIPDAVPGVTTTNLYNTGGILTWPLGFSASTVNTGQGANELYDMDQNVTTADSPAFVSVLLDNNGVRMEDTNASHFLLWAVGSNLTDNRTLTFTTGDSDRTLTLSGNPTLGDWFDQNVKTTGTPTFSTVAATTFTGNLTGNVTGNVSGSAGSVAVGGITGLGTGVGAALAINVGSAGAPVLFNGAGGTPASLTLTNATGLPAASLVAGTIGGAYTTSGLWTFDGGLVTGTGNDDVLRVRGAYNADAASQMILSWTTNMGRIVVQGADASTNAGLTILSTTSNGSSALTILNVSAAGLLTPGDNIVLGSNFLSGDGGDEGISVGSTGDVTISSASAQLYFLASSGDATFHIGTDSSISADWRFIVDDLLKDMSIRNVTTEFMFFDSSQIAVEFDAVIRRNFEAGVTIGMEFYPDADVAGAKYAEFYNASGVAQGSITATNSTTTAFNTTSDVRLKRDLGLASSISVLRDTRVHRFTWKATGREDVGVFAQEAINVHPLAVTKGNDTGTPWMVDYSKYVPSLIVGWQNHDAQLHAQQKEINALRADLARLGARQR